MTATPSALPLLTGLHHVTAIASDPRRNVDFYIRVLGLRLIKRTVNFDDPSTYHLYYGDHAGNPGTVLTFFPWPGARRGRPGSGQVYATAFSISTESLGFWSDRLQSLGVPVTVAADRFGDRVLEFSDPDGMKLELIASATTAISSDSVSTAIPATHAIRGFHSVTIALAATAATEAVLTGSMNYRVVHQNGRRTRLGLSLGIGSYVDLLKDPSLPLGTSGAGTVHHVAFRTPDDASQSAAHRHLTQAGLHVSPVMDRNYFHSIYYREPAGILFEIATDTPGFAIDEPLSSLGTTLKLPAQYETRRAEIEAVLPKLT